MGSEQSSESEAEQVPPPELWYRHRNCTVRATHQFRYLKKKQLCDYCRIVKKERPL